MKSIYEFLFSEHLLKSKTVASTQDNDCVDLGLPSGLLWAKCNIGAKESYDYGDYFMWGSTEPDTDKPCGWAHAPFNDGYEEFNKKYFKSIKNKVCPNGTLAPDYDAASIIIDDNWRLPTEDEYKELIDNTKHEWINNYNDSKVNGMLFEANGADLATALFIPASGYRDGFSFYCRGSDGCLWTSSLYTSSPHCARSFNINVSSCNMHYYDYRCCGFCLRGVKEN